VLAVDEYGDQGGIWLGDGNGSLVVSSVKTLHQGPYGKKTAHPFAENRGLSPIIPSRRKVGPRLPGTNTGQKPTARHAKKTQKVAYRIFHQHRTCFMSTKVGVLYIQGPVAAVGVGGNGGDHEGAVRISGEEEAA